MEIVVSLGVLYVTIPDVTGMPPPAAETGITAPGLTHGEIIETYIDLYLSGQVFLQSPSPGETAIHDAPMDLSISLASGPARTKHLQRRSPRINPRV